jgi:hypothetical protein
MSFFSKRIAENSFLIRTGLQILIFLALTAFTVLFFRPVSRDIHAKMEKLRNELIGKAEAFIGRPIRYSSIGPSIFGTLDIRNIRVLSASGTEGGLSPEDQPLLQISRFRLSYSLPDLIRRKPEFIRAIKIDKPVVNFDTDRDGDILRLFDSGNADVLAFIRGLAESLPERMLLSVHRGQFSVHNNKNLYRIQKLNIDAGIADKQISLEGGWSAELALGFRPLVPIRSVVNMQVKGSCSTDLDEGNAVIKIPSIAGDLFRVKAQAFSFSMGNDLLSLHRIEDRLPLDFSFDYGLKTGILEAFFSCNEFTLGDLVVFSGPGERGRNAFAFVSGGAASFRRDAGGGIRYSVDLGGRIPAAAVRPAGGGPLRNGEAAFYLIKAAGDEDGAVINEFRIHVPRAKAGLFQGGVGFSGSVAFNPLAPEGTLSFSEFSLTGDESLSAEFTIGFQEGAIKAFCETADIGRLMLTALDFSVLPSGNDLAFSLSALRFRNIESYEDVRLSSFSLEGTLDYEPRQIQASFLLDSFSTADLIDMARPFIREPALSRPLRSVWNDISVTTEIFFTTDFNHVLYNAPRFVVAYEGSGNIAGILSVSGTDQRFELSEGRLIGKEGALLVSGYADYGNPGNISFSLTTNYRDLSYYFEGMILDGRSVNIQGSYGFRINVTSTNTGGYSGYMEVRNIPVPWRGQMAHIGFLASLRYNSRSFWSLDLDHFEASDIASPSGPASLRLTGGADQTGLVFPVMYYNDSKGPLSGRADVSWSEDFTAFSGKINMEDAQGLERYLIDGSYSGKHLDLAVAGLGMQLSRVFDGAYNAAADGDIRISWDSVNSFRANFRLSSLSARIQEQEFRASASAELDSGEFTVRDLRLSYSNMEGFMPLLRISLRENTAETRVDFRGYAAGRRVEGAFTINAAFRPIESWLEINAAAASFSGGLYVENLSYANLRSVEPFDFTFSRNSAALSVFGGPKNMFRLEVDRDGNFYLGLSNPFPVRGSVTGSISNRFIDAHVSDLYVDLGSLWEFIPPVPELALAGGYVNGSLDIRGSLDDPEFFGAARATSVRIRVPNYITRDIRPIPFNIVIEGNEIRFGPIPATVGGGAGTVEGWFRFDRWIPNIFDMDIYVPRDTPIPFGFDITGFLAKGDVSGQLQLSMENLVFDISGDLYANNTEIGLNTDEITRAQGVDIFSSTILPVTLNLKIITGPTVEFLWPSSDFPILRANPDMGTVVEVNLDTPARQFSLNSDVKIRGGEIFYFERSFYIRQGTLSFHENELQFTPQLTARAEARDRSDEGPVTISMIVENAPLLSFTARFESSPPLSQMEIFELLGQNLTGAQVDESTGGIQRAFLNSSSDLLAQFTVVRRLERYVRNFLHLDMLSARTQVLQNAFFRAAGIQQTPVDMNSGVGNYFDNTTVFLGKYIGADMFIQSMLSMRYDENKTTFGGLSFEPDVGVELQTPLFSIRWDFIPTHPENWYVNDNSITLTWSRSF